MSTRYKTIEDLVKNYVPFAHGVSKGWNKVYCEACGDGRRIKGPRGGWLFQEEMAFYHCFNCGVNGSFDPYRKHPRSKDMVDIMSSFGIPEGEIRLLEFLNRGKDGKSEPGTFKSSAIETLPIPDHFYLLSEAPGDDALADAAESFLWDKKRIRVESYPFYLSSDKTFKNRLIIPAFRGENMIFYQTRRLDDVEKNKYLSCGKPRANIIYGMDRLYEDIKSPLFVTEGFFDSHHLNGVAVMENNMTSQQIELLNRSPRRKVIVPDWKGDSAKLMDQAVKEGWSVSSPRFGSEVKDITDAVVKFGRLFVAHEVVQNIKSGMAARIAARVSGM